MGNPQLRHIDNINLTSFSSTAYVRMEWWQQRKGKRYYRLKLTKYTGFSPSDFPTTYLYLGSYDTVPNYYYTATFAIESVKNSSLVNTSFEALFTRYSDRTSLRVMVELQSSANSSFSSYETSTESRWFDINLTGDNFGPTWTCPTWIDEKYATIAGVRTLTGSNRKGVQGVSRIRFDISTATGRYGTTVESYSIAVTGGFSHNLTPSHVSNVGTDYLSLNTYYKLVGDVSVTFTVTDSRGMKTSFTRTITIVSYKSLYLTTDNSHRQGGTGSTVLLDFTGRWFGSPLSLTCTGIEAYEEGSSTVYASLNPTITVSGTSFSFSGVWSGVTFDSDKSYKITATFSDTVKTVTLTIPIPVGTPVLSIRDKKVGVNNSSPSYALDVGGVIGQNGQAIMGFVKEIVDETSSNSVDLNNYKTAGYYVYGTLVNDVYHFPNTTNANRACVVEVVGFGSYIIQKLFYLYDAETHVRAYNTYGWTSWKKVTMT